MRYLSFCLVFGWTSFAFAQQDFGPGTGEPYGTGTLSGHGGAVSPYQFSSWINANVPDSWTVARINRIRIFDLATNSFQGLQFSLLNGEDDVAVLTHGSPTGANLNGDYTFVDDPSLPTLAETAAGLSDSQTVPHGTYRMSGGTLIFGNPGNMADLSHFAGSRAWPGWRLLLLNYTLVNSGSFSGWDMNVTLDPVPEPASLAAIGVASMFFLGRRRARR